MKRSPSIPHYVFEQCWGPCSLDGPVSQQFVAAALHILFGGYVAHPNLPSYLGTWEELVKALSNNPFVGSGRAPQPHLLHSLTERKGPQPDLWSPASALFVVAAGLKDMVSRLPEGPEESTWNGDYLGRLTTGKTGTAATEPGLVRM